jgi:hypothetical protein
MRRETRAGFQRRDLLTILLLVLVLFCLGSAAILQVRAAAVGMQCRNNLKQIVIACENLHATCGYLSSNPDTVNGRFGTLQYHLLPYME